MRRLMDVYKSCLFQSPRVKIGPAPGVIGFPYYIYSEYLKNLFLQKSQGLEL